MALAEPIFADEALADAAEPEAFAAWPEDVDGADEAAPEPLAEDSADDAPSPVRGKAAKTKPAKPAKPAKAEKPGKAAKPAKAEKPVAPESAKAKGKAKPPGKADKSSRRARDEESPDAVVQLGAASRMRVPVAPAMAFQHDGIGQLRLLALVLGAVLLVLLGTAGALISRMAVGQARVGTMANGSLMAPEALDKPLDESGSAMLTWTTQAATQAMTFGFHDYKQRLGGANRDFTSKGWREFRQMLDQGRVLDDIEKTKRVITAEPRGAPTVTDKGAKDGVYRWTLILPMNFNFGAGGGTDRSVTPAEVTLQVVRVQPLVNLDGLQIDGWQVEFK